MIFIIPPSQTARHSISDHKAVPSEKELLVAILARGHWGMFCGDETLVTNEIDFNDGNEDILRTKSTKKVLKAMKVSQTQENSTKFSFLPKYAFCQNCVRVSKMDWFMSPWRTREVVLI